MRRSNDESRARSDRMRLLAPALVGVTFAMVVTSADADILLTAGNNLNPGLNVQLTDQPNGTTINGTIQGAGMTILPQFTSTSPLFIQGNDILPTVPDTLHDVTVSIPSPPPGFFFTGLLFDIENPVGPGGTLTVTATDQDGTVHTASVPEGVAADNFFTMQAINPELWQSVEIETSVGFADLSGIRFNNANGFVPIPGPTVGTGLPGLIAVLGGLVALARRRRKQLA